MNIFYKFNCISFKCIEHVARIGESRDAYRVLVGKPEGRNHLKDPDVDGRIILQSILEKWDGGTEWTAVAQDRYRWWAVVNAAMNLRVP